MQVNSRSTFLSTNIDFGRDSKLTFRLPRLPITQSRKQIQSIESNQSSQWQKKKGKCTFIIVLTEASRTFVDTKRGTVPFHSYTRATRDVSTSWLARFVNKIVRPAGPTRGSHAFGATIWGRKKGGGWRADRFSILKSRNLNTIRLRLFTSGLPIATSLSRGTRFSHARWPSV